MFLGMKIRKNIQFMYPKRCYEEKHVDSLLIEEGKNNMFLSKFLIHSCIIIQL